jgi:hypothetical protein
MGADIKRAIGQLALVAVLGMVIAAAWEANQLKSEIRRSGDNATVYKCIAAAKATAIEKASRTSRATIYTWASAVALGLLALRCSERVASWCNWDAALKNQCAVMFWAVLGGTVLAVALWSVRHLGGVRCRPIEVLVGLVIGSAALLPGALYFGCRRRDSGSKARRSQGGANEPFLEADVQL